MKHACLTLLLVAATHTLPAQEISQLPNLVLDLDAAKGVTTEEGARVSIWRNQVSTFAAQDFVKRDEGRKEAGSGRPTLRHSALEFGGLPALQFLQQELVCLDEQAFDGLTTGGGCTWVSVVAPRTQRVGLKDVNSFFGNLKNGGNFEGLWGNFNDDNSVWWGGRNGITFGRFDPNNPKITGPKLETGRAYVIAGRMPAGIGMVKLQLFVNDATPVATTDFPVNANANPSRMAVGQERDATNHPGVESFDGDIARLLIWQRPLTDEELGAALDSLRRSYQVKTEPAPKAPTAK